MRYDKSVHVNENEIRIAVTGDHRCVRYNGAVVADITSDHEMGPFVFIVGEDGEQVTYDILVLRSEKVAIFLGRNGQLLFSDDECIRKNRVAKVVDHLKGAEVAPA